MTRRGCEARTISTETARFETQFVTPPVATTISSLQFDPDLHQPSFDEWTLGFRRQFPGQIAMDVAGIVKVNHDQFAQVDINGFYPDAPFKPFGGFGRVDPNQGLLYRLTNNTWGTTHYRALQATVSKNMSHGFQALFTVQRQWQHLEGTWNPSDPAKFIQPDAFPNNALIWRTDGVQDHNSLATGGSLTNNPMWNPYSVRMAGTWHAPAGVVVSGSYTIVAGTWNGPVIDQIPANSPLLAPFGPSTVTSSTGVRQPNPLATRIRFYYPTRGEGQTRAPDVHAVGVKVRQDHPPGWRSQPRAVHRCVQPPERRQIHRVLAHGTQSNLQPAELSDLYEPADSPGGDGADRVSILEPIS